MEAQVQTVTETVKPKSTKTVSKAPVDKALKEECIKEMDDLLKAKGITDKKKLKHISAQLYYFYLRG